MARAHYDYDWSGATEDLKHAVQLGPSDADANFWLGFVLVLQERFDEAFHSYDRACALDPHNPGMATHRAPATWMLGDAAGGEEALVRIAADHPTLADVHAIHAVPLAREGRWLDYVEANRRGAEITDGHPIFRARQALGLQREGRTAEARALVEELESGARDGLSSNIRLVLALAVNDQDGARLALDRAIEERQPMVLWYRLKGIIPREWARGRIGVMNV